MSSCSSHKPRCSSNWKVTGYYTPISEDFSPNLNKVVKVNRYKTTRFNQEFINSVKIEGWGKTRFGWYLGYYNNLWHKTNTALNALGHPLTIGAVAVDNRVINTGEIITIPVIQDYLNVTAFTANDIGSGVKNKHIDIYTGEGEKAKLLAYKITGIHQVCKSARNLVPVVEVVSQ
jgi:3D (Asp-Asp-Asp) domain-containing protein